MPTTSRDLRDRVVRGLAKVGLVWALAVLGFVFTAGAAAGSAPTAQSSAADSHFSFVNTGEAPRTAGLALALVVLGGGITVLAIGGLRTPPPAPSQVGAPRLDSAGEPSRPRGLSLSSYSAA